MQRLKEDIKNRTFKKYYLLYGEEDYLKRLYRDSLKNSVLDDSDEMNYSYYEGKGIDLLEVREIADTLPFFSDYRIIVLENSGLLKSASEFSDYLMEMPETTVLLFVEKEVDKRNKIYKLIQKEGVATELGRMSEKDTKHWIAMTLQQAGKQMRESTAEYLLSQIDNSLTNIGNELEKLIAYSQERSEITKEDVNEICTVQVTGRIFEMIDSVAAGKKQQTLSLYHDLLELHESPMSILYLLTRQFNILLQIKELGEKYSKAELAKKIGVPPFAVGKYMAQGRHFSIKQLQDMLEKCIDTEYQFKRGNLTDQIGVELLLVEFIG